MFIKSATKLLQQLCVIARLYVVPAILEHQTSEHLPLLLNAGLQVLDQAVAPQDQAMGLIPYAGVTAPVRVVLLEVGLAVVLVVVALAEDDNRPLTELKKKPSSPAPLPCWDWFS